MTSDVVHDSKISRLIEEALIEDIGLGDITTESIVPAGTWGKAAIIAKSSGVIAGLPIAELVFRSVDPEISLMSQCRDGDEVPDSSVIAWVDGPLSGILKAERTALNFIQRMSGIATMTRSFVKTVHGTNAKITDTRKTAPSLRIIDKLAVEIGGGVNHRFGLDDMVLIKDNHIAVAGGISPAIQKCLLYLRASGLDVKVEVETKNLEEVREVLKHEGIHRIMLDNFSIEMVREAVHTINKRAEIEASGNVSLDNVRAIAETGVDFISIGALTHSAKALDISLEVKQITAHS